MYLYFVPFHHRINLGSTVLYFFFLFFIIAAFCSIPQLSKLCFFPMLPDDDTFLVIGLFLNYFFYPQPRLAMLVPPPGLSHCYTRSRLCLPVHTLLFAARLYRIVSMYLGP